MYVQPFEGSLAPNPLSSLDGGAEEDGSLSQGAAAPAAGDNISRFVPPWLNDGAAASYGEASNNPSMQGLFGPLMGMLQQLMAMLQSLMGYGGCGSPYGNNGSCAPYGKERFFQNPSGSSQGDPHLSFNGSRWTSMASQPDLLDSRSFAGGYQISTQASQPNAKGVSWNQSVTVSLNDGATKVTLDHEGQASISSYGQSIAIARGQTLNLGDGESVTYEQNGSLRVNAQNAMGGRISTMLTAKGNGVDVDVTAHDVDLGGALVNGSAQPGPGPLPNPVSGWPPVNDSHQLQQPSASAPPVALPDF
jgi:hypothetical protein